MSEVTFTFKAVYAAHRRCIPELVGYMWHRSDTGRRWFEPLTPEPPSTDSPPR